MANNDNVVPTQNQGDSTRMNLMNDVTITNNTGVHRFKAGSNVEVPKAYADNVAEIDYNAQKARNNLVQGNNYTIDAGTL